MALLGLLFYLASILFGLTSVNYFFGKRVKEIIPKYAFGFPIGYAIAAYTVLLQEAAVGVFSSAEVAAAAVILLVLSLVFYLYAESKDMFRLSKIIKELRSDAVYHVSLFAVVASLMILQLAGIHHSSLGIVAGDNFGPDFLFHTGIGNSLVYSGFPPTLLYAYNATNVYPFITDFYSSILMYEGLGIVWSTWLMNLLLWFSLATSAIYFISLFLKNRLLSVPCFVMFLLMGLGFNMLIVYLFHINLWIFPPGTLQNAGSNLIAFVQYPFFNFSDPMISNFSIQHDYLLGFPYAVALLSIIYLMFFNKEAKLKDRQKGIGIGEMAFLGMLAGLMVLIHPDSLIFVFLFALTAMLYSLATDRRRGELFLRVWLPFGIVAALFAVPLVVYIHSHPLPAGFFSYSYLQSFWYVSGNWILTIPTDVWLHLVFWVESMGLLFVLGILGMYFFRDRLYLFAPAIIVWLMVNVIQLQPSFGDSNKLIIYFMLFLAIAAMKMFYELFQRWKPFAVIAVAFFILITFSGFISETSVFSYYTIASNVALAASNWAAHNTTSGSIFMSNCVDNTFGFLSTIGGRRSVLEYYYYIYSTGIYNYNPGQVYSQVDSFYQNPTCSVIEQYNVSYVALESLSYFAPNWCFGVNTSAFLNNYTTVASFVNASAGDSVYILKPQCH